MTRASRLIYSVVLVAAVGCAESAGPAAKPATVNAPAAAPASAQREPDGLLVRVGDGLLKLQVCAADVVHVAYAKN